MDCSEIKLRSVGIGALLILATTTVPFLLLINIIPFAGIIISGAVAAWYYIIMCQVRLSPSEAFVFSGITGITGSVLSATAQFVLVELFDFYPGKETAVALLEHSRTGSPENDSVIDQMLETLDAPLEMSISAFIAAVVVRTIFFAPAAGLGGVMTVWWLKNRAKRK